MRAVDLVISGHDTSRATNTHSQLEGHQINLAESTVRDNAIHSHALMLLIIADKMLQGSRNSLLLHALAEMARQRTRQNSIFGEGLEAPSA